ncbi:MAG TPA: MBL fold metallo-hydrolase, partial [Clostridia bacterium]|nr:MBL fold metallo-hydrolase [Clostridia bacterium]
DHLDPWTLEAYREAGGSAPVAVPAPEAHRLDGLAKPVPARAEQPFRIGSLTVTPIPCAHTQLQTDGEGRFYHLSYLIQGNGDCLFFGGDMSLYDGLVERLRQARCRLLLLPCNGRDADRTARGIIGNITAAEAAWFSRETGAEGFVPMHHDLYAINGCPVAEIEAAARAEGVRVRPLPPMGSLDWASL